MRVHVLVKRLAVVAAGLLAVYVLKLNFNVSILDVFYKSPLESTHSFQQFGQRPSQRPLPLTWHLNRTVAKNAYGRLGEYCKFRNKLVIFGSFNQKFAENKFRSFQAQMTNCRLPRKATCEYTYINTRYTSADVVYVHECFYNPAYKDRAHPHQILLHYNLGPEVFPCNMLGRNSNLWDMRVSYTSSSTITIPYLCLAGVRQPTLDALAMSPPVNRHGIAMFVSDCKSGYSKWRSDYLRRLLRHIHIDSYGLCFHNTEFDSTRKEPDYFKLKIDLIRTKRYKFLICFENSVTTEYVTEKIWHAYMTQSIPIYYGAPEIYDQVPGANTFIDAAKFSGPAELAQYIKQVDSNETLYKSYFKFDVNHMTAFQEKYCTAANNLACQICKKSFEFKRNQCSL